MSDTIYVGADHRGFTKKNELITLLTSSQIDVNIVDISQDTPDPQDDYNDAAAAVAQKVLAEPSAKGILLCGSGHGMCIQANRFHGIRAVNPPTVVSVVEAREHSDANVLCLAADYLDTQTMVDIAEAFLTTKMLEQPNYHRRIERLDATPNQEEEF